MLALPRLSSTSRWPALATRLWQGPGAPRTQYLALKLTKVAMATDVDAGTQPSTSGSRPKVVVVTGPTAVGKSQIGVEIAKLVGGEIISADSVQVYRGLDVGSDKITAEKMQGVPHHLIDVRDAHQDYAAGEFYDEARAAVSDILGRGKVPIVVGGVGFYLRWLVHGKARTGRRNAASAEQAEAALAAHLSDAATSLGRELSAEERWQLTCDLIAKLGDPGRASSVRREANNYYRAGRAIEILLSNGGVPIAELDVDTAAPLDYDFRCFFLHRPRQLLYDRMTPRVEAMIAGGLLQEALAMLQAGVPPGSNCASKAIGYRQAMDFLLARRAAGTATCADVQQLATDISAATRNLAKAQFNWFRNTETRYQWVDVQALGPPEAAARYIIDEVNKPQHTGYSGTDGRLSKEETQQLKMYAPKLAVLCQSEAAAEVAHWVNAQIAAGAIPQTCAPPAQRQPLNYGHRLSLPAKRSAADNGGTQTTESQLDGAV